MIKTTFTSIVGIGILLFFPTVQAFELSPTDCLARNIYFEARGESTVGKIAVGLTVLNRAKSPRWPMEICGVVWDDWQFSWTKDGKRDIPADMDAFREAWLIADALLQKEIGVIDFTENATHYHSDEIQPSWSEKLEFITQIGAHKFYR